MDSAKPNKNNVINLKEVFIGVTSLVMLLSMLYAASGVVHYSGLPKADEILYKAYPGATADTIVDEFLLGVTDWVDGPYRIELYNRMISAGQKLSPQDPMAKFDFIAINCRDYKETSGTENFPLNDSNFRIALSYIYGVDNKQIDIFGYVGAPWTYAIGNPVPPAQEPWYDEDIQMPDTDWDTAWAILQACGYEVRSGVHNVVIEDFSFHPQSLTIFKDDKIVWTNNDPVVHTLWFVYAEDKSTYLMSNPILPGESWSYVFSDSAELRYYCFDSLWVNGSITVKIQTDYWLYRDDTRIRNMKVYYPAGDLYWERGPGLGFVRNFNDFISYIGSQGPVMTLIPVYYPTLVTQLLVFHDFDFICHSLTDLGRYVDWLYDMLHSSNIGFWGWNFCGISDADFDKWTINILTNLNVAGVIADASLVQNKFVYELMPWFPISSGRGFCTTARDSRGELMNLISMPNYGPMNDWSWMCLHWNGAVSGGTIKVALGDAWHTMNPYTEFTPYGRQILDRAVTGLLSLNPNTLQNMPYIANEYSLSPGITIPELGITAGSYATFYLRQDVYWHDGKPVTAYDCVNNMRLLRQYKPGRYSSTWAMLVYEEADGPYKFNAYFYTPSLYWADNAAETALLSPKHITDAAETMYGSILTGWEPAFNSYEDLMGYAPPAKYSFMKQVVGCGPFVYDYANPSTMTARVQRFEEYFINAPAIGSVVGEWRVNPYTTYTYKVLVQNIAAKDSVSGELVGMTVDIMVYEDDVLTHSINDVLLDAWDFTYLGPYTTGALSGGYHHVTVKIYEDTLGLVHTYDHEYYAVPREDVTTCAGNLRDCFVDVKDILRAAIAYGSYPGSLRWDPPCDVNDDFFVDVKDLLAIALKYGWLGTPKP